MLNSIGKKDHWKVITDEHFVKEEDGAKFYELIFTEAEVFGNEQYPIKVTISLLNNREKKVSANTGNEYQIAGEASAIVFGQSQSNRMFGGISKKSGKQYASCSFGEEHEMRMHEEREKMPLNLLIMQDNPGLTFAEIKKYRMQNKELPTSKATWKVCFTEIWTKEEAGIDDHGVEEDFAKEPEAADSIDRDKLS